ncbi:MAG: F0F1 ATP synthase subunit B [Flavobacteriales bacterium]|jgi:F-type H+-transporting ATPase subunit b
MGALLTPAFGTVIWATVAFLVVLLLLRKFAWGPILSALQERERGIAEALGAADRARQEMAALNSENERLLQEARAERDRMLREAREMGDAVVAEARAKAKAEADREVAVARDAIAVERKAALSDLKVEVAKLSLDIAEQVLRTQLDRPAVQTELVDRLIEESPLN